MRRLLEAGTALGIAAAVHVAAFAGLAPEGGVRGEGEAGDALVSVQPADPGIVAAAIARVAPPRIPPVEPVTDIPSDDPPPEPPRLAMAQTRLPLPEPIAPAGAEGELSGTAAPARPLAFDGVRAIRAMEMTPERAQDSVARLPDRTEAPSRSTVPERLRPLAPAERDPYPDTDAPAAPRDSRAAQANAPETAPPARPRPERPVIRTARAGAADTAQAARRAEGDGGGSAAGLSDTAPVATRRAGAEADLRARWGAELRARIERARAAADPVGSGRAVVQFVLTREGRLVSAEIASGSGNPALDRAALAAVRRAGPFPAAPSGLAGDRHAFSVPVSFRR